MISKLIVGVFLVSALTLGLSLPALADTSCYTGCSPGPVGIVGSGHAPTPGLRSSQSPSPVPVPSGGLPFTGTDVGQTIAIASVLLGAGYAMVRTSRRRARSTS